MVTAYMNPSTELNVLSFLDQVWVEGNQVVFFVVQAEVVEVVLLFLVLVETLKRMLVVLSVNLS